MNLETAAAAEAADDAAAMAAGAEAVTAGSANAASTFDAFSSALPHAAPSAGRFFAWGTGSCESPKMVMSA
jgi:hypothetical protein